MLLMIVLSVVSSCSESITPRDVDVFPSAFKDGYVTLSAVPNRVAIDTIISVKMTALPLVSGRGRMQLRCNTHTGSWWSMISPYELPRIYDTSFGSGLIAYDTSFTANEEFIMEWRVKLSSMSLHTFRGSIVIDSLFVADSGRYIPVYSFKDPDGARYEQAISCRGSCLQIQP
jgi:hypothetical protein